MTERVAVAASASRTASTARSSSSTRARTRVVQVGARCSRRRGVEVVGRDARRAAAGDRLDRHVARGTVLEVERSALPPTDEDEYYAFELVGLEVVEEGGRPLGTVTPVPRCRERRARARHGQCCCRWSRTASATSIWRRTYPRRPGFSTRLTLAARRLHPRSARLRVADRAAPGRDRARRRARPAALLLPRLHAAPRGQVDDEPYGGGAGMVLRVDVVAAALDAVYGGAPSILWSRSARRGGS
jgi:hypothetical protein